MALFSSKSTPVLGAECRTFPHFAGERSEDLSCEHAARALFRQLDATGVGCIQRAQVLPLWPALSRHVEGGSAAALLAQLRQNDAPITKTEWAALTDAMRAVVGPRRFRGSLRRAEALLGEVDGGASPVPPAAPYTAWAPELPQLAGTTPTKKVAPDRGRQGPLPAFASPGPNSAASSSSSPSWASRSQKSFSRGMGVDPSLFKDPGSQLGSSASSPSNSGPGAGRASPSGRSPANQTNMRRWGPLGRPLRRLRSMEPAIGSVEEDKEWQPSPEVPPQRLHSRSSDSQISYGHKSLKATLSGQQLAPLGQDATAEATPPRGVLAALDVETPDEVDEDLRRRVRRFLRNKQQSGELEGRTREVQKELMAELNVSPQRFRTIFRNELARSSGKLRRSSSSSSVGTDVIRHLNMEEGPVRQTSKESAVSSLVIPSRLSVLDSSYAGSRATSKSVTTIAPSEVWEEQQLLDSHEQLELQDQQKATLPAGEEEAPVDVPKLGFYAGRIVVLPNDAAGEAAEEEMRQTLAMSLSGTRRGLPPIALEVEEDSAVEDGSSAASTIVVLVNGDRNDGIPQVQLWTPSKQGGKQAIKVLRKPESELDAEAEAISAKLLPDSVLDEDVQALHARRHGEVILDEADQATCIKARQVLVAGSIEGTLVAALERSTSPDSPGPQAVCGSPGSSQESATPPVNPTLMRTTAFRKGDLASALAAGAHEEMLRSSRGSEALEQPILHEELRLKAEASLLALAAHGGMAAALRDSLQTAAADVLLRAKAIDVLLEASSNGRLEDTMCRLHSPDLPPDDLSPQTKLSLPQAEGTKQEPPVRDSRAVALRSLLKATEDGYLEDAVAQVQRAEETKQEPPVRDSRAVALRSLLKATEDGYLEDAVAQVQRVSTEQGEPPQQLTTQQRMCETLTKASQDGRFEAAISQKSGKEAEGTKQEPPVRDSRAVALRSLLKATEDGYLEDAVAQVQRVSTEQGEPPQQLTTQERMCETLIKASQDGRFEAAISQKSGKEASTLQQRALNVLERRYQDCSLGPTLMALRASPTVDTLRSEPMRDNTDLDRLRAALCRGVGDGSLALALETAGHICDDELHLDAKAAARLKAQEALEAALGDMEALPLESGDDELRLEAKAAFLRGACDGTLGAALASTQPLEQQPEQAPPARIHEARRSSLNEEDEAAEFGGSLKAVLPSTLPTTGSEPCDEQKEAADELLQAQTRARDILLKASSNGRLQDVVRPRTETEEPEKDLYPRGRRPGMLMAALDKKDLSFASTAVPQEAQTPHEDDSRLEGLEEESEMFGDTPTFFDKLQAKGVRRTSQLVRYRDPAPPVALCDVRQATAPDAAKRTAADVAEEKAFLRRYRELRNQRPASTRRLSDGQKTPLIGGIWRPTTGTTGRSASPGLSGVVSPAVTATEWPKVSGTTEAEPRRPSSADHMVVTAEDIARIQAMAEQQSSTANSDSLDVDEESLAELMAEVQGQKQDEEILVAPLCETGQSLEESQEEDGQSKELEMVPDAGDHLDHTTMPEEPNDPAKEQQIDIPANQDIQQLQGELEAERNAHQSTLYQLKELERKLRLANMRPKRSPPRRRFGIADPQPYSTPPVPLARVKEQQSNARAQQRPAGSPKRPRLSQQRPVKKSPAPTPHAKAVAEAKAALKEESLAPLSRAERSRARVQAIHKLSSTGASTWSARRAEKVARLQDLKVFSESMWDSFFEWREDVDATAAEEEVDIIAVENELK